VHTNEEKRIRNVHLLKINTNKNEENRIPTYRSTIGRQLERESET
jgi:hypothetical protein